MNKNTYSLLSSNWMFSADTENTLMPFLISIMNGSEVSATLNPTGFMTASINGAINPFESDAPSAIASKENKVGIIQVHHPIFKYDQNCGPKGTQTIMSILENWKQDENIVAVVMDYNSGGGQASGTREAARYIFNYDKPIVSYSNDVVGSAAYYLYAAGKHRMINQYADFIGCIGTMMHNVDLSGIIEKAGGKITEAYSDLSPKKNHQSRQLKEGNERPAIEKFLNPDALTFHNDMREFNPSISDEALKGDVFSPKEALTEGLIDSFGTLQDAINKAFELSKENKNSNPKSNTNMNTKSLPKVEAVLGLDAPLASTDNGSFLNEEQLSTIDAHLETLETANATVTGQLNDANTAHATAIEAVQNQLTEANTTATTVETSVNAILTNAGLPVEGTLTEKLTAINTKAEVFGKSDGATHTKPKVGQEGNPTATNVVGGTDVSAAMNN